MALIPTSKNLGISDNEEDKAHDFKYSGDPSRELEVARVQLLFEFTIVPHVRADDEPPPVDEEELNPEIVQCAFVSYFSPFADARNHPLYHGEDNRGMSNRSIVLGV